MKEAEVLRITNEDDPQQILRTPHTATKEECEKAFKQLAVVLHPDKNATPGATEAFQKLRKACACLTEEAALRKALPQRAQEGRRKRTRH